MKRVFICSPYRGDIETNVKIAKGIGRLAATCNYCPIVPHLMYPEFMNDEDPEDRIRELTMGANLLEVCDMIWLVGNVISKGMRYEIEKAKEMKIPFRIYDRHGNRINPNTIAIDDRITDEMLATLEGVEFD